MDKEKLIEILNNYFDIMTDTSTYELTRCKTGFQYGTVTIDDFEEWTEENIIDLAEFILKELQPCTPTTTD